MAKYKRRRYFIDKKLQTKYIVLTIVLLMIYTLLFAIILLSPYILALSFDAPIQEQAEAAKTLLTLHNSIWPALGAVMLIMSFLSIPITHKMAGPIYRFRTDLAEISSGNLNISIKLRDKDDLKDLAEDLNRVIVELKTFVQITQESDQVMLECIKGLEKGIKENEISSETGQKLIEIMQKDRVVAAQVLSKYTTANQVVD